MLTTWNIEEEVLSVVKDLFRRQRRTAGVVMSDLARQALIKSASESKAGPSDPRPLFGFRPFAFLGRVASNPSVVRRRQKKGT